MITEHYGNSILPYLSSNIDITDSNEKANLPIIVRSKIKYATIRSSLNNKLGDRQSIFPDSTLRGPRREIR